MLENKDALALLPTGGGKSICFQVPAMLMKGICVVITPLIALMEDQVNRLQQRGMAAVSVHSGMSRKEIDIVLDNCVYGKIKFLYVSPERLQTEIFRERFLKMTVCLVAIDEAHCISQWGYDFRPSYLKISGLRDLNSDVPFIALTASATELVKNDIKTQLRLRTPVSFQKSFARENLSFVVRKTETKEKKLLEILKKVPGSAIVYVRSRKATQDLCRWIQRQKITATFYHAGLTHTERKSRQEMWITNQVRVIVATNAFGMGIDKPDVRIVVHVDLPENPESYYQEAGRAGRDGKRAYAALVYHDVDIVALRNNAQQSEPTLEYLKKIYQGLANYYQLAVGSSAGESYDFDLEEFSKQFNFRSPAVYVALKKLEQEGLIQLNESFYRPSRIHLSIDKTRLYEFQVANVRYDPVIKALLRLYGAELFSDFVAVAEARIAQALKVTEKDAIAELNKLSQLQILNFEQASDKPQITFVLPRQDANHLPIDRIKMEERRKVNLEKMEAMVNYATQTHRCRMQVIQDYFGEEPFSVCGMCDVCIDRKKKENLALFNDFRNQIIFLLQKNPLTVEALEESVAPNDHELFIEVVREMVDGKEIYYDEVWVLHLSKSKKAG